MLQKNTYSPFRKPELSSLHALFFISLVALIFFISTTNVYSAQVTLAWDPNSESDLAGYKIYKASSSGDYNGVNGENVDKDKTRHTIPGLVEGQTYYFVLTAYDIFNNESGYSAEVVGVAILDPTPPSTPTSFQATTISTSQINLSWNASSDNIGVTGYKIYRDSTLIATTSITTYPDTGLSSSTTYSYTVSAYDASFNESGQSSASSATTLSLSGNNPPVLSPIGNKSVNEGQALSFTISATDLDGDTLSYTASNLPSGASFNANTKTFTWTPANNQTGYSNITFQVSDGKDTDSESITITVGNINRPPELDTIANITVSEGATVVLSPTTTDPDGDTLKYTYTGWMTSSSYTTNYNDSGIHTVTITVSDGTLMDSQIVTIIVLNSNRAPVIDPMTDITVNEGVAITLSPTAADPDGDALTYTYSGWMSSASYTTTYGDAGTHTVTVTVSDGSLSDSQVVTIIVNDTTPIVAGDIDGNGQEDIIIDYGTDRGIWTLMNDSTWMQLHTLSPETMTTGDMDGNGQDDIIIDFGDPYGIWILMNNSTWVNLIGLSPKIITTGDMDGNGLDEVIVDFGDPYGIWILMNNSTWVNLIGLSPEIITTGDMDGNGLDEVIIDFGDPYGIWILMNNSTWVNLIDLSPKIITTGDMDGNGLDEVIVDFGDLYGIWSLMNNSTWVKLVGVSSEIITTGDMDGNGQDEVIVDGGDLYGIWIFKNNNGWVKLHDLSPEIITTGDMDGNGQDEVIIDFGDPDGIQIMMNNSTWKKVD